MGGLTCSEKDPFWNPRIKIQEKKKVLSRMQRLFLEPIINEPLQLVKYKGREEVSNNPKDDKTPGGTQKTMLWNPSQWI